MWLFSQTGVSLVFFGVWWCYCHSLLCVSYWWTHSL